jgi:hypothetical protein
MPVSPASSPASPRNTTQGLQDMKANPLYAVTATAYAVTASGAARV